MYTCSSYSFCLDDQYFHFAIATGQKETIDLVAVDAIPLLLLVLRVLQLLSTYSCYP